MVGDLPPQGGRPLPPMRAGEPVPEQTSGKAVAGGLGAAIGGILTSIVTGLVVNMTGAEMSPELTFNVGVVCTAAGAAIGGWVGAYFKRNYLK